VQKQVHPGQRVLHPEPAPHQVGDPGQRPALVLIPPPHGRPGVQRRLQFQQLNWGQLDERAANSHDVQRILPLIAEDATYWFTDGSYRGREEITDALERTFAAVHDEVYGIRELEWVAATDEFAACRFRFSWRGVVDGQPSSGWGRGTNVLVQRSLAGPARAPELLMMAFR
jgi:hypothetical protein